MKNRDFQAQFQSIQDYKELQITKPDGQDSELLVLSHYPIPCFNRHYYGAYHFYGHVHDSYEWNMMEHLRRQFEELYTQPCNMINIGAMLPYINYTPRTFNEIIEKYDVFREKTIDDIPEIHLIDNTAAISKAQKAFKGVSEQLGVTDENDVQDLVDEIRKGDDL